MDENLYPHVVRAVLERPWAILPNTLATIVDLVRLRASGGHLSQEEIRARLAAAAAENGPRRGRQRGAVAVIPMYGVLMPKANLMSAMSGGTSVEQLRASFREALADPEVDAIVFDIDSPGGQVDGIPELAAEIRGARGQKPILANANTMAASAAYWLGAQADEITVTSSGVVGSIGVVAAHSDMSKADEMDGVKTTFIHHGKYKVEGNSHEPLGEEARAAIQADVDAFGLMFETDVARGRGVPVDTVRASFGQGRTFLAKEALSRGMVDRVETLEDTVRRAGRQAVAQSRAPSYGLLAAAPEHPAEPLDETVDDGAIVSPDADSAEALVSGPLLSDRLALVSEQLDATVTHLRDHIAMRTREGRSLSQATQGLVERLLAVRPDLDEIEAMVRSETPRATAPAPMRRDLPLLLLEEATRGGYRID